MAAFSALTSTRLGTFGESFIKEFAKSKNLKPYIPAIDESFPVDSICLTKEWKTVAIEAKTKPRMRFYNKTGYDKADHEVYLELNMPVWVMFIDYIAGTIYGQYAHVLDKQKEIQKSWVLFPLSAMTEYRKLTQSERSSLEEMGNSNYY
jgi:hypothetical protein